MHLNAKGKTDAHIYISASERSFLVDAAADLREALKVRLERYVIADDVQIEDVTINFRFFTCCHNSPPLWSMGGLSLCAVLLNRHGTYGAMLRSITSRYRNYPRDGPLGIPTRLSHANRAGNSALGPRVNKRHSSNRSQFWNNARSTTKRVVYIGQEVISRHKKSRARRTNDLCGLISLDDLTLQPGMKLAAPSAPAKDVGLDHKRCAQRENRKRNSPGICKTRLQQRWHEAGRIRDGRF